MKKTTGSASIWIVVVVVLIVIGGIFAFRKGAEAPSNGVTESESADLLSGNAGIPIDENGAPSDSGPPPETNDEPPPADDGQSGGPLGQFTVLYSDDGYSPNTLEIRQSESVKFVNESGGNMWPASAVHPTHAAYPNSGITKCGTPEEEGIFDACRGIAPGGSWEFVFTEAGEWKYHDHLDTSETGTVVVKEFAGQ